MTRQSVTPHRGVLEAGGLVTARRRGRDRRIDGDPAAIRDVCECWIQQFERDPAGRATPARQRA